MLLQSGARLGPYEILSAIGAGGMGEVYRARDTKLNRNVAIKVLPALFASDAERLARFTREAQTLASLNHPNIAHIHGLEESDGVRALVMELVEGEDLSQRIARGPIPIDEALPIATQIADALEAAHEQGIIHRDLKPANIKVREDGTVKVLDFGLAKMLETSDAAPPGRLGALLTNSPTIISPAMMTGVGVILGTAAYMSPEQAKGRPADKRSDMWAFGCVLFEMLAGCAAFEGGTTSEILAGVLKTDPDWGRLPAGTPEAIRRLLRRCLRKDDTLRLRDVGDARLEIDEAQIERVAPQPDATPLRSTERLAWAGAVAVLGLLAAAIGAWAIRPVPARPEERFDIVTPAAPDQLFLASVALSPDRRTLLFVAESDGQPFLWFRALDSVVARPLPGTGGAFHPFWSPDSRSIGFFSAEGQLKRLDLDGGLVRTLTKATVGVGGDWNRDGVILFAPSPASPISRISANGGPPVALTRLGQGQAAHAFPHFLPDGRSFLYYVTAGPDTRGIYLGHLDGAPPRRLLDADAGATYTNGHLLFIRQTRVFAQAFDADRLELNGSPFQVAEGVAGGAGGFLTLSAVPGGAIAFRAGGARFGRQFVRMDRSGNQIETVGDVFGASRDGISLSPDGRRLVFFQRGVTNADLWTFDTRRGVLSRFTSDPAEDVFPIWSRDGTRIAFSSNRSGQFALYQKPTTGSGGEELLLPAPGDEIFACDMSPDGHTLLYQQRSAKTGWDIWAVPLSGDPKPSPVVQTDADERGGLLSPDGKWLAYVANDSGAFEVYVQPFPGPGPRVQVSTKGGDQIRWASSGRELFYIALDGKLTSARLQIGADGRSLNVDTPVPLFTANVGLSGGPHYVVSADGQRFLMNAVVRDADAPIRLILNWNPRP